MVLYTSSSPETQSAKACHQADVADVAAMPQRARLPLHMASTLLHTLCEDKSKSCTTSATPANASEWPEIYGITFIQMMHILFIVNTFLRNRTPHFVSGQPEFRIGHCVCYFARNARRISVLGRICREKWIIFVPDSDYFGKVGWWGGGGLQWGMCVYISSDSFGMMAKCSFSAWGLGPHI